MDGIFSDRIADVPRSFIREILNVTLDDTVISFAGGLPNRTLFPVEALARAAARVFAEAGGDALQYSNTEGFGPLRAFISERYRRQGLEIPAERILITTGSQQGLDLLGKILLNDGDEVLIEEPGYIGAIQAFSVYRPRFRPVPVGDEGMDVGVLEAVLRGSAPKLAYTVPNFQNPSGISYTAANRERVAGLLAGSRTLLVEDNPYGELRFSGQAAPSFMQLLPEQTVLLGSFSKTVVPAFRLGWIAPPPRLMDKLITAKQAADLHTDAFAQRLLHRYLCDNDLDAHIARITETYGRQRDAMVAAIDRHLPSGVRITHPDGGMFLWATLPEGMSALALFERALARKVVFVPGDPFYVGRTHVNTLRLNFSCAGEAEIAEGIRRLGEAMAG